MKTRSIISALAIAISAASAFAADIPLDSLDLAKAGAHAGKITPNTSAKPSPLTINGTKFDKGLGAQGNASLVLELTGPAKSLSVDVGLDDGSHPDAKARFYILGDGKLLADSGIVAKSEAPKTLKADLTGVKQLVLRTDDVQSQIKSTFANWVKGTLTTDGSAAVIDSAHAVPELQVYLDQLDVTKATTGWNEPQINQSAEHNPLTLRGKTFKHGFGTHALSVFVIDLKGAAKSFSSIVGVDDDASELGSIGFTIIGDGKILAKSGTVTRDQPAKTLTADLTGVKQLVLQVDSGDDDNLDMDHADWADPVITLDPAKAKDRPVAIDADKAILPK